MDFSAVAIENALVLNDRLRLDARFIHCDVNRLDEVLEAKFDVVFASFGVIGWHSDLVKCSRIVSRFLKKDGRFCFAEFHSVLWMLRDDHAGIGYSYFQSASIIVEEENSYASPVAARLGTSYCWNHGLGEFFHALESQGLTIKNFKEYD